MATTIHDDPRVLILEACEREGLLKAVAEYMFCTNLRYARSQLIDSFEGEFDELICEIGGLLESNMRPIAGEGHIPSYDEAAFEEWYKQFVTLPAKEDTAA